MPRLLLLAIALFSAGGCYIPFYYSHDTGEACALDGDRLVDVRQVNAGWAVDEIGPCPKFRHVTSNYAIYTASYNLATPAATMTRSPGVAVDEESSFGYRSDVAEKAKLIRQRLGVSGVLNLWYSDDPRLKKMHPKFLPADELADLRRLGFEPTDQTFGVSFWRWEGPQELVYLDATNGDELVIYCPRRNRVRRRRMPHSFLIEWEAIWDPDHDRLAVVDRMTRVSDPVQIVTTWDYAADAVRTVKLNAE